MKTINVDREIYKKLRGRAMQRRDRAISDKLHEVHKPWHQRSTPNSVHHPGTILFDLTQNKKPMITQVDLKHLSTTKLVELKLMVEKELKFRDEVGKEIEMRKQQEAREKNIYQLGQNRSIIA